ncbi:MAG: ABC transporter ATP-binding protein [Polyangiaceae bacterium]|nr:ABC transporter ATP-binding protein [Polyangiaceae bacterium]
MVDSDIVLAAHRLTKTFAIPFTSRKVDAVSRVSFTVARGDIFGFLGPNGAGKTTTIKMLTGLIAITSGTATILGEKAPSPEALGKVGFLPENPSIYPYLTPREFITLCGRLSGMAGQPLKHAVVHAADRMGITEVMNRPARALSKGMLQRTGLAAALVHTPELLILDEPMGGLDPVGRKQVRDLIFEQARAGRTVFFSSHILSDVEMLCTNVCILHKGKVVADGTMRSLLGEGARRSEITLDGASDELCTKLQALAAKVDRIGTAVVLEVQGDDAVRAVLECALANKARVESVTPKRETLEDVFVRLAI